MLVRTKVEVGTPALSHTHPSTSRSPNKISRALAIIASYDGQFDDVCFTVNVYCGADVKVRWDEDAGISDSISPRCGGFSVKVRLRVDATVCIRSSPRQVDGTLTTKNAGGNHTHPTYMLNPQWHLRIFDGNTGSNRTGSFLSNGKASPLRGYVGNSRMVGVGGKSKACQRSVVVLSAQGPREAPLNVTAVWSSGERIVE